MVDIEECADAVTVVPPSQDRLLDAEEIEKVAATLTRPTARMHLEGLAKKLRKESEALKRVEASKSQASSSGSTAMETEEVLQETTNNAPTPISTTTPTPKPTPAPVISKTVAYVPIDKFAFDAGGYNSAFLTLYIDLPGVGAIPKENVTCNFTEKTFDLIVKDLNGKSYRLFKDNLENDLHVMKCQYKIKRDKVLIKLGKKKTDYGGFESWNALTSKKPKKEASKKIDDPTSSIMDLMKDMYESGDDNMKKVIGETMMKQREGKLDKSPDYGGMGDMDMDL